MKTAMPRTKIPAPLRCLVIARAHLNCNRFKGSNLNGIDPLDGITRLSAAGTSKA